MPTDDAPPACYCILGLREPAPQSDFVKSLRASIATLPSPLGVCPVFRDRRRDRRNVASTSEHLANRFFGNLESFGQLRRLFAASLSEIRSPTTTTADGGRDRSNPFAGTQLFSLQILA